MKKHITIFAISYLLLAISLNAGVITKTLKFNPNQLTLSKANGFDVPQLANFASISEVGKPILPEAVFYVLVPANATVTKIEVIQTKMTELPGTYYPSCPTTETNIGSKFGCFGWSRPSDLSISQALSR